MNELIHKQLTNTDISNLVDEFKRNIQPIINEIIKINSCHILSYILHKDGNSEYVAKYTEEQQSLLKYLNELIDIERKKIEDRISKYYEEG